MTGGAKLEFSAVDLDAAMITATERYRLLMGDPEAKLPWSTHFEFFEEPGADDGSEFQVLVRIEFDRKVLETMTSTAPQD